VKTRKPSPYLLLANIGQLLTLRGDAGPRRGYALKDVGLVEKAAVLCGGGKIIAAGPQSDIVRHPWLKKNKRKVQEIDCKGRVVLPGLIDSHTHPAFMEPRLLDFEKRIAGSSYQEIAAAGGGIRSSLAGVRAAKRPQLAEKVLSYLEAMLEHGTTTVEAKSGYGLTAKDEIKSLEAIRDASRHFPGTVVRTLLAAHVVPPEFEDHPDQYVSKICDEMIPLAARKKLADFVDAFCERGAFTQTQTEKIFAAAGKHGLGIRAHVGQFTAAKLDALLKYQPASLDHMDFVNPEDFKLLARSNTMVTLLPGASYFLGHKEFTDARRFIDSGAALALATDFNPGTSPTPSMAFIISLACTHMRMEPAEAITACTINAAQALRLQTRKGSIGTGKDADLAIFDVGDYREIAYWFAWNRCAGTIVAGQPRMRDMR
jgi:imidazolonepropionase